MTQLLDAHRDNESVYADGMVIKDYALKLLGQAHMDDRFRPAYDQFLQTIRHTDSSAFADKATALEFCDRLKSMSFGSEEIPMVFHDFIDDLETIVTQIFDQFVEEEDPEGLKAHFAKFRPGIVGDTHVYDTPYGKKRLVYADWVAMGRLYRPVEDAVVERFGPEAGNTHTDTSRVGEMTTAAYEKSHEIIREHINASDEDVVLTTGNGMTGAINKLQRMLGLRDGVEIPESERPVVFVTHMEHHSNHTSWLETSADVEVINPDENGLPDLEHLEELCKKYKDRPKIGAFTACSNVTGIVTPYHKMAGIMHKHAGLAFVDFAASAPYTDIDMHPENDLERLDAVVFSAHKFLGGPGASGVLSFNKNLYKRDVPVDVGGGIVKWTNRWGQYRFVDDIEERETAGTPGILQSIRVAMALKVQEAMDSAKIKKREEQLLEQTFPGLQSIPGIHILADHIQDRYGIVSFYHEKIHYNLMVKLLSDRYGIQMRGGCACAGTYGHYLLNVSREQSQEITDAIDGGDLSTKPGWVRLSLHPTMTDAELKYILRAIGEIVENIDEWHKDYRFVSNTASWEYVGKSPVKEPDVGEFFELNI